MQCHKRANAHKHHYNGAYYGNPKYHADGLSPAGIGAFIPQLFSRGCRNKKNGINPAMRAGKYLAGLSGFKFDSSVTVLAIAFRFHFWHFSLRRPHHNGEKLAL